MRTRIPYDMAKYAIEARKYKKEHAEYELKLAGCTKKTEDIHHDRGKEGKRLLDKKHWKAACRKCHQKVTENSKESN